MKSLIVLMSLLFTANSFAENLAVLNVPTSVMSYSSELEEVVDFIESELSDPRSDLSEYVDEYGEINPNMIKGMLRKVSEHAGFSLGSFSKAVQYSLPILNKGKIVTEIFITTIEDESQNYLTIIIADRASVKTGF